MIAAKTYQDKTVAVFGLGVSGRAAVRSLLAVNAEVLAWDDSEVSRTNAAKAGVPLVDLSRSDWSCIDALVLAPGVPLTHPEPHWAVKLARSAGVQVIGDTELFVQSINVADRKACLVAITGTNGKSTTTALIGHILISAGRVAEIGGNIGAPVLELPGPVEGGYYVVEFSSYQIDLTPSLKPDVAVLLNLTPDHLNRHGGMDGYVATKARLFANQTDLDVAIISMDDEHCRTIASQIEGPSLHYISVERPLDTGVCVIDAKLVQTQDRTVIAGCDMSGIEGLRGSHNWQNAAAAWSVCRALGLNLKEIVEGFKSFPGLAHRMEQVARSEDILFINDSKATNADAAARALDSFKNIYWIVGGLAKDSGIESLKRFFPRIRRAYLIGEAAGAFAKTLAGNVDSLECGTIDAAVPAAFQDALREGGKAVILLSPACASFDQFRNFEIRGEAFCCAVAALDGVSMKSQEAA